MVRNQRDEPDNATTFAAINYVEDFDYDCNTATTVGDALATYLKHLGDRGQLNASTAA